MDECSGNGAYNSSFIFRVFDGAFRIRRLTLSQPVDNDTSISEQVDKVLMEIGHLESRASKMDIDDLLKCGNKRADDCRI